MASPPNPAVRRFAWFAAASIVWKVAVIAVALLVIARFLTGGGL